MNETHTISERLEQLETLIEQLELRIGMLEASVGKPRPPVMNPKYENQCSICGLEFANSTGYVCNNTACPMYPKIGDIIFGSDTGG